MICMSMQPAAAAVSPANPSAPVLTHEHCLPSMQGQPECTIHAPALWAMKKSNPVNSLAPTDAPTIWPYLAVGACLGLVGSIPMFLATRSMMAALILAVGVFALLAVAGYFSAPTRVTFTPTHVLIHNRKGTTAIARSDIAAVRIFSDQMHWATTDFSDKTSSSYKIMIFGGGQHLLGVIDGRRFGLERVPEILAHLGCPANLNVEQVSNAQIKAHHPQALTTFERNPWLFQVVLLGIVAMISALVVVVVL